MKKTELIEVEVAYALPHKQKIYTLLVERGVNALEATRRTSVESDFPGVDLDKVKMGIFGQNIKSPANHLLKANDRVEIYRPLIADPKEARKRRAAKAQEDIAR
ncbi:MAG: putative ubiquitin-RnfH superfamily antitoxin RatB of RatAB toxin-antitoxin module [Cellvibrionaceae bacterium]|jgi:putative ubiquitin-RnfH superfamily antitoxin RatB of RatAB toxin-antitoxin module